ncbi:MAG: ribosome-associated translation inhibitor RaiA [Candidatus Zambryskibacteria bacterium]|nr:ribosome-associated translation inhibitor RaiA [Candidatus Zambryskibacteria bacterium]
MKINIKATNIELTPAISNYVNRKISTIEKYFENKPELVAQVEVGKFTQHHKSGDIFRAEVHVVGAGIDLYAASSQSDLYAAIDLVKDEIIRNALHFKGKRESIARRGARMVKDMIRGFNIFKKRG